MKPLLARPYFTFPQAVAADGTVIFQEDNPATGLDLWTLAPDGRAAPLVVTPFNENQASLSPDGRLRGVRL